ncbi:peptide chain release factor N(5)-glutamine methyltransferase [Alphaproteobacteria bacterium]|nr:peptide chain release factor N(5)-glutamine methyltransferase [Alphaproteobacteria bacterium]MDB9869892.1 peptide chain release factor N(5)-glutamine methyltransferase [Alphaproteobacteria bacterium]
MDHKTINTEAYFITKEAIQDLKNNHNQTPNLDSRILLGFAMGLDRAIYPHEKIYITENEINIFKKYIQSRIKGKPVSRILGFKNFWKMNFKISKATLDPRPDSEVIIETIIKFYPDKSKILRVLDLGSGSGCLGLSILYEYNKSKVFFLDRSLESLKIAKYNALKYKMEKRSEFICLNWNNEMWDKELHNIVKGNLFDIIISNPPYIPSSQIQELQIEVKTFEPAMALDGGKDGLTSYRCILPKLENLLSSEGHAFIEIGINQKNDINKIANSCDLIFKESNKDLSDVIRVLVYGLK